MLQRLCSKYCNFIFVIQLRFQYHSQPPGLFPLKYYFHMLIFVCLHFLHSQSTCKFSAIQAFVSLCWCQVLSSVSELVSLTKCITIIITIISFMQGIYTYIPGTNNVPKEYNIAVILSLLFMAPISLVPALTLMYFYIIIIIITISFMKGIYTYIPETMSLRNTMLQLFCRYCVWCPYH
jgi:hypothetical protein